MKKERLTMTVTMQVTPAQALALQAMFDYWNQLSGLGGSREVAFYADGDGNFHPKCQYLFSEKLPELTPEMRTKAVIRDNHGDRLYDFDPVAWMLRAKEEKQVSRQAVSASVADAKRAMEHVENESPQQDENSQS